MAGGIKNKEVKVGDFMLIVVDGSFYFFKVWTEGLHAGKTPHEVSTANSRGLQWDVYWCL